MSAESAATERLKTLAVSDTGFIFDPRTGHTYTVNETGLALLAALKEGLSPGDAAARIAERFDAPASAIEDDVGAFVATLRDLGLAPPADAGSAR